MKRNEEVRRRALIERELASRADQRVLRWFGHVERMNEYHIAIRMSMARKLRKKITVYYHLLLPLTLLTCRADYLAFTGNKPYGVARPQAVYT